MKSGSTTIARNLARRLFPVAFGLGFLISVGFPALYTVHEYRSLRQQAAIHARELAERLRVVVLEDETLWKYQAHRYDQIVQDFLLYKGIATVRVLDEYGRPISGFDRGQNAPHFWDRFTISGKAPIVFNRLPVGTVVIGLSSGPLTRVAFIFFLIASAVATAFTIVIYLYPLRVVEHLESDLQALNESLEQRVADRTAQLEAANSELESFSYSVSHDLRAPLRHISGYIEAFREDYGEKLEGDALSYLNRIGAASVRMDHLIEAMLGLSRISRNEMRLEVVDLSAFAWDIAEELRRADTTRQVTFDCADGIVVTGDPFLLRNVMENLLRNAWKFTGKRESAVIEFGTSEVDGKRAFFVRDNGAGFDMRFAGRLFAPFQRLHRAEEFDGTGIGLATVQRIVHRHGGRIWAESEPDRGATFYFTLEGNLLNQEG